MSDFTVVNSFPRTETYGAITGSTSGTAVTSGASVNTRGSWVELTPATGIACASFVVSISDISKAGWFAIDIGIGASGSEQIIVEAIYARCQSLTRSNVATYDLQIKIPLGARVAVRAWGEVATTVGKVIITGMSGGPESVSYAQLEHMSFIGGNYSGYTANTKGSWTEVFTTLKAYKAIHITYVLMDFDATGNTTVFFDVGLGPLGSELAVLSNLCTAAMVASTQYMYSWQNFKVVGGLPANSRLSVRTQTSSAASVNKFWGFAIHGYT